MTSTLNKGQYMPAGLTVEGRTRQWLFDGPYNPAALHLFLPLSFSHTRLLLRSLRARTER